MKNVFLTVCFLFFTTVTVATVPDQIEKEAVSTVENKPIPPNIIVISIDGVSRTAMYPLLKKNALPNISNLIVDGNIQNMFVDTTKDPLSIQLHHLIAENEHGLLSIRSQDESIQIVGIDNQINFQAVSPSVTVSRNTQEGRFKAGKLKRLISEKITMLQPPFVMYFNFIDPQVAVKRSREGAERYSNAIKACDYYIGQLHKQIKELEWDQNTIWILTTNHGYAAKSRNPISESWVASSIKLRKKGYQNQLLPTIYHFLGLKNENLGISLH